MADIRIKDLATTASVTASDDFMAVDGTTSGTRKLSAATPSFATSVTVPSVSGPTATDLTLAGGSTGASLVLGQGTAAANIILTPKGTGKVGIGTATPNKTFEVFKDNATSTLGSGEVVRILGDDGNTAGRVTELGFGTGPTGASFSPILIGAVNISASGYGTKDLYFATRGGVGDNAPTERMRLTSTGNLLIGGTTDITGSGGLKVFGTTAASTSQSGAFQVGGSTAALSVGIGGGNINAGGTGTFGGAVSVANDLTVSSNITANSTGSAVGNFNSTAVSGAAVRFQQSGAATSYVGSSKYAISNAHTTSDLGLATVAGNIYLAPSGTVALTLATTGAATFAGAVTVSSTTAGSAGAGALVVSGGLATGAASYFGGNVTVAGTGIQVNAAGFGGAPNSYYAISSAQTLSGNGNQAFLNVSPTFNADAAGGQGNVLWVQGRTAASYTLAALAGLKVESPSIGAGGAVTTVYGLRIQDQTGGGTNYAIFTGAGRVSFGDLVFPQQAATAPTYVKGAIYFDSTLNKLRVGGATGWETITSV